MDTILGRKPDYQQFAPEVLVESDGPIRIVTLNRPEVRNAVNPKISDALADIWRELGRDRDAAVVIITGAGRAFSAGGDIPTFRTGIDDREVRRFNMREAQRLAEAMASSHLPVIAAVNGAAAGLGCSVVSLCDIVIMSEKAFLVDPHVSLGLVAGDGPVASWPLMMSLLRAKEYLLTGERIPAADALALGLANRVVPPEQLMEEAMNFARRLAKQPRQAIQDTKRALNLHLIQAIRQVMPFALATESESFLMTELHESIAQFEERT
ncbi:enoyl-CoA hydratase/isomerase family protein [Sphingomonas sp. SRS2]|uniref:enoyl-CoA hydratase/isomerase family protein n=1 Tax=Sphingomonas sp. SRS2 TaxID=133190 RepID=UPI0006184D61|nr:enoyl-CoA hydratase/isomerase family protein [Sphingomonas sp. SRS2]KKC25211.1 enoyl-CoA hydratase [Sphingomonas sp. SRS2]